MKEVFLKGFFGVIMKKRIEKYCFGVKNYFYMFVFFLSQDIKIFLEVRFFKILLWKSLNIKVGEQYKIVIYL